MGEVGTIITIIAIAIVTILGLMIWPDIVDFITNAMP